VDQEQRGWVTSAAVDGDGQSGGIERTILKPSHEWDVRSTTIAQTAAAETAPNNEREVFVRDRDGGARRISLNVANELVERGLADRACRAGHVRLKLGLRMEASSMAAEAMILTEPVTAPALERHYSVAHVAELWRLSETKVRELFRDEPGVLQTQLRTLRSRKRQNVTLRIPESVLLRVHERMSVGR